MKRLMGLFTGRSAKDASHLAVGTASAQAVTLALTPLLTRLFGPDVYGESGALLSLANIVAVAASLGLQTSIVVAPRGDEARGLLRIGIVATLLTSILASLLIVVISPSLYLALNMESELTLYLLGPLIASIGLTGLMKHYLIREGKFQRVAFGRLAQSLVAGLGQLAVSVVAVTSAAFTAFIALGFFASALSYSTRLHFRSFPQHLSIPRTRQLLVRYREFPLFRMPQEFVATLTQNLPQIMLVAAVGVGAAGHYAIAMRLFSIPISLVAESAGQVLLRQFSRADPASTTTFQRLLRATLIFSALGAIPFATVAVFGPQLFGFIFGEQWVVSGSYAAWMVAWLYPMFINTPAVRMIPVLGLQKMHLIFEVVSLLLRTGSIALSAILRPGDGLIAISLFSIVSGALSLLLIGIVMREARKSDFERNHPPEDEFVPIEAETT